MNNNAEKQEVLTCQIIIQPVENGFIIQAVNVEGNQSERRLIATDVEGTRKLIHEIADAFYGAKVENFVRSTTIHSPKEE